MDQGADGAGRDATVPWIVGQRRTTSEALRLRLCAALLCADAGALIATFLLAAIFRYVDSWFAILAVAIPVFIGTALNSGAYAVAALRRRDGGSMAALRALAFTFGALFLISYFFRIEQRLPRSLLLATMIGTAALIIIGRRALASVVRRNWKDQLVTELVILDGTPLALHGPRLCIEAAQAGIRPDLRDPVMLNRFAEMVRDVDRVVVASPPQRRKAWAMMLKGANVLGEVVIDEISDVNAFGLSRIDRHETLTVSSGPLDLTQRISKRGLDVALCSAALLALAPVLIIVAIAIKLDSRGPVFFRQRRVGRGNAFFEILKFRSMYVDMCDADGRVSTRRDDDRITRVGRIIRRTSIDELPQLLNVLGGSMSLVGPRPHALGSLAGDHLFWDVDERYWQRHVLKPGITGLAQVRGFRGATAHRDDLVNRLQSDLEYAANWSIGRDLFILFSTLRVLVHKNTF